MLSNDHACAGFSLRLAGSLLGVGWIPRTSRRAADLRVQGNAPAGAEARGVNEVTKIKISWSRGAVTASLQDTPTARQLLAALPCESSANTWGEEVYFTLPVKAKLEPDARQVVDPGAVCFWVQGSSLALPYGPTPVSQGKECRLVTEVNVLGAIEGNPRALATVRDGDRIKLELAG